MVNKVVLEEAAQEFSEANKPHPRIYELEPKDGRALLEEVQSSPVDKYNVDIEDTTFTTEKFGDVPVRFIRPEGSSEKLPVIFYIHGAGWVFGSAKTHDKLVRELAVRTHSVVVFPEYTLSPEAKYPTAIEQNYDVLQQLKDISHEKNLDIHKLTVAGDSVGGNMATVMTIMTKQRNGLPINQQLLYYPVTNAEFDTESYHQFAENYFLAKEGMQWFWDQYTTDANERDEITASPLKASVEELKGLPSAMILNAEADVLRDEGEAYANKLREAGVEVTHMRFQGIIHDFVMVNSMDQTNATRAAMDISTNWINKKNK
ncbi:alpha/beta hydrolase fold domain-containing protein [Mammaliicoccus sciuri]|uniref:alpha/beta hydrolase fold domain-containing protein n=1 Tax=Mammaliicoccus sciuri TaxID=1296 RepID=UPI000ED865A2|nr:alpha/beta hydrolase [Mammaliicoccus sciuri]HCW36224.1 lipase [Staphylococcus sp.]MCD3218830.1 alpha/beta hydrolase [Mammaliicoccus sciuri]MCJ0909641.1 alpha/beta hydrolase [Mammaliicoccus sciuri]MCJ0925061.1 alpha/beta hydrolase [Mammaliicoccus sciuri]MCJ1761407.1 alpha/beta hydrolase [Mammaliicoccus sciuri]